MSKIIVGVDGSERSDDALALASSLARRTAAEIVLARAYPYDDAVTHLGESAQRHRLREDAQQTLDRLRELGVPLAQGSLLGAPRRRMGAARSDAVARCRRRRQFGRLDIEERGVQRGFPPRPGVVEGGQLQQPDRLLQLRGEREVLGSLELQRLFHDYIRKCSPR